MPLRAPPCPSIGAAIRRSPSLRRLRSPPKQQSNPHTLIIRDKRTVHQVPTDFVTDTNRPRGDFVAKASPAPRPSRITLEGRTVTLEPIRAVHADFLFHRIGGNENAWLWDYTSNDPLTDVEQLRNRLVALENSDDPLFWTIKVLFPSPIPGQVGAESVPSSSSTACRVAAGYLSFLNITPAHRSIEVGNVLFSPVLQRTTAATEAIYLLARYVFRGLGYRRLEWKCDSLNESSKRAAIRYGFTFEGLFRQHYIVKGRNRDTAWFSILDSEWERNIEFAFEQWLDPSNFDEAGKQKRKLEHFRAFPG